MNFEMGKRYKVSEVFDSVRVGMKLDFRSTTGKWDVIAVVGKVVIGTFWLFHNVQNLNSFSQTLIPIGTCPVVNGVKYKYYTKIGSSSSSTFSLVEEYNPDKVINRNRLLQVGDMVRVTHRDKSVLEGMVAEINVDKGIAYVHHKIPTILEHPISYSRQGSTVIAGLCIEIPVITQQVALLR